MGSENSKQFRDNSLLSFDDNSIDYDGVITTEESSIDEENNDEDKDIFQCIPDKNNNNIIKPQVDKNKVPVTFEWDQGGNSVYVTGSFCNWEQFFLMKKKPNGHHSLTLKVTKGLIQYKFKVDEQWKCNEKFPITNDNGNKNNFIDTTNWEISVENSEDNTIANTNNNTCQNSIIDFSLKHKANKSFNAQSNYSNYFPKIEEMNEFASKIPEAYKIKIDLNSISKQDKIGNNKYLANDEENLFGENYSYKKVKNLRHEQINHLNYKSYNNRKNKDGNGNPIINSIICRYRLKFTSFVYYK
jgi:hypothetical protein